MNCTVADGVLVLLMDVAPGSAMVILTGVSETRRKARQIEKASTVLREALVRGAMVKATNGTRCLSLCTLLLGDARMTERRRPDECPWLAHAIHGDTCANFFEAFLQKQAQRGRGLHLRRPWSPGTSGS